MSSKKPQGKLIVFSAPSGSGKTTIVKHLLKQIDLNLEFSISATSRDKRGDEINGKDYYFLSTQEFIQHIKKDDFFYYTDINDSQVKSNKKFDFKLSFGLPVRFHDFFDLTNLKKAILLCDIIVILVKHDEFKSLVLNENQILIDFCGV